MTKKINKKLQIKKFIIKKLVNKKLSNLVKTKEKN